MHTKKALIALGPEKLAEALCGLADIHPDTHETIKRLLRSQEKSSSLFEKNIKRFLSSKKPRFGYEARKAIDELHSILADLEAGADNPEKGLKMVTRLLKADGRILGCCDDSSGDFGVFFKYDVKDLFVRYAAKIQDRSILPDLLMELLADDPFDFRNNLLEHAKEFMSDGAIHELQTKIEKVLESTTDERVQQRWLFALSTLAKMRKDGVLYEKTVLARRSNLYAGACIDIAKVYFDGGDFPRSLAWLERKECLDSHQESERLELLLSVQNSMGDTKSAEKTALSLFHRYRTLETFENYLALTGPKQRESVINEEIKLITKEKMISFTDLAFLLDIGKKELAEDYLFKKNDQLNGEFYGTLLPLADAFEKADAPFSTFLIYRALLESILERAKSTIYHHGVKYLRKMEILSKRITDWKGERNYEEFYSLLLEKHARKSSFWGRLRKRGGTT